MSRPARPLPPLLADRLRTAVHIGLLTAFTVGFIFQKDGVGEAHWQPLAGLLGVAILLALALTPVILVATQWRLRRR